MKKWGEGVSLIRGPWKGRDRQETKDENGDDSEDSGEGGEKISPLDQMDSENDKGNDHDQIHEVVHDGGEMAGRDDVANDDPLVDGLTKTMGSLSLVPPSIRFGRGGKNGGFAQNARMGDNYQARGHFRGRGRGRGRRSQASGGDVPQPSGVMEVDSANMQPVPLQVAGTGARGGGGLGWAGRGRAGIVQIPMSRGTPMWRGPRGRG